eukprot:GHVN01096052.1.p1 GENE.GHVN01096052.1~~GHVN01096052.1.p1  ORF type:complete len:851 (-),score=202.76 GHVN01096052.1:1642-4194(-)
MGKDSTPVCTQEVIELDDDSDDNNEILKEYDDDDEYDDQGSDHTVKDGAVDQLGGDEQPIILSDEEDDCLQNEVHGSDCDVAELGEEQQEEQRSSRVSVPYPTMPSVPHDCQPHHGLMDDKDLCNRLSALAISDAPSHRHPACSQAHSQPRSPHSESAPVATESLPPATPPRVVETHKGDLNEDECVPVTTLIGRSPYSKRRVIESDSEDDEKQVRGKASIFTRCTNDDLSLPVTVEGVKNGGKATASRLGGGRLNRNEGYSEEMESEKDEPSEALETHEGVGGVEEDDPTVDNDDGDADNEMGAEVDEASDEGEEEGEDDDASFIDDRSELSCEESEEDDSDDDDDDEDYVEDDDKNEVSSDDDDESDDEVDEKGDLPVKGARRGRTRGKRRGRCSASRTIEVADAILSDEDEVDEDGGTPVHPSSPQPRYRKGEQRQSRISSPSSHSKSSPSANSSPEPDPIAKMCKLGSPEDSSSDDNSDTQNKSTSLNRRHKSHTPPSTPPLSGIRYTPTTSLKFKPMMTPTNTRHHQDESPSPSSSKYLAVSTPIDLSPAPNTPARITAGTRNTSSGTPRGLPPSPPSSPLGSNHFSPSGDRSTGHQGTAKSPHVRASIAQVGNVGHSEFKKRKRDIAVEWYQRFNETVFDNQLPTCLTIEWNARLVKTAGQTVMSSRKGVKICKVLLSDKVLDTYDRLRKTLLHECCHVAQFLIDGELKPPHGSAFMKWARSATRVYPSLAVTVRHTYDIHCPHQYTCVQCGHIYGRHSKSIDTDRMRCGKEHCKGRLEYEGHYKPDGTPVKQRAPTGFSLFVKVSLSFDQAVAPPLRSGVSCVCVCGFACCVGYFCVWFLCVL